ncbi:hypothetical protein PYW08_002633 [Mythimna loreyi]|uniref:Uncharacterized protein n=1 Tax=Mythimna loreyi TaxID=667449 RepID=A0ACC2QMG5_9NEOP|nr:hypothetical protein PYW08_002633 [Mythimna loreyi]
MLPHVNGNQENIEDDEIPFAFDNVKNITWYDRILLNRPLRIILVLLIATIATPILVYKFIFLPTLELPPSDGLSMGSCLVPREARLPCGIEAVTPDKCHEQCCYDHENHLCFHRYPSRFSYLFHGHWTEETDLHPRLPKVPYSEAKSYKNIRLSIDEITATHLALTFHHSNNTEGRRLKEKNYSYSITEPDKRHSERTELNIIVNSTQGNIFNTARGPLIAADNIWEISFRLTNETMYGLGEIPLKPGTVKVLYNHKGGLNSIPLVFARLNGSYHGLLIESMAPTEVIVRGDNQLVLRSITTLGLKFHLFVGPKPSDVMKDVMVALGVKRDLEYWMLGAHVCREPTTNDPLRELSTFISSATANGLPYESHCGAVPVVFETDCNDTMINLVNQGEALLRKAQKKFVPHVSPYIKYKPPHDNETTTETETTTEGHTSTTTPTTTTPIPRCFDDAKFDHYNLRDPNLYNLYLGQVNNHDVIYPGYKWASEKFMQHLWAFNTNFEAVILENNWPLDESEKDREAFYEYLPYFNQNFEAAFNVTPQWNATRPTRRPDWRNTRLISDSEYPGEQYFKRHNEYGNEFINAFGKIKGSIPTSSTSQWLNGNVTINRQNITTSWTNLRKELVEASLGGVSGHWYWSSPICGDTVEFNNVTQTRLCAKWYMAATYMPMIKIHSKGIARDPIGFAGINRLHMIRALNRRLSLLPYIYTVLQDGPLLRPMFYQFPLSTNLTDLTTQFAVGDDLVIVPNLEPSQTHIHLWKPPGTWYEFWGGLEIIGDEGFAITMTTTESDFFTMVRAGSIIIMQKETQLTADLTRLQSNYSLVIALKCETEISTATDELISTTEPITESDDITNSTIGIDSTTIGTSEEPEEISTTTEEPINTVTTCEAKGKLFMNENITLAFRANATHITVTAQKNEELDFNVFCNETVSTWASNVKEIVLYGLDEKENNYDTKKLISGETPLMDLCQLADSDEIFYKFINDEN